MVSLCGNILCSYVIQLQRKKSIRQEGTSLGSHTINTKLSIIVLYFLKRVVAIFVYLKVATHVHVPLSIEYIYEHFILPIDKLHDIYLGSTQTLLFFEQKDVGHLSITF